MSTGALHELVYELNGSVLLDGLSLGAWKRGSRQWMVWSSRCLLNFGGCIGTLQTRAAEKTG